MEQLGSGIPRILEHYGKESFQFTEFFLRMTFVKGIIEEESETGGPIGGLIGGLIEDLTDRQKEVLNLIKED